MSENGVRTAAKTATIAPIRWYQKLNSGRVSPCRHVPGCSTYAIEAIDSHGALKGGWLGVKRIARCHPWGSSGYDPVPEANSPTRPTPDRNVN